MLKYIPNALSIARIFLAITMLFLVPFTTPFMIVYVVGGVSDMIDGPLARKMGWATDLGATLDSMGDLLFVLIGVFRVLPVIELRPWVIAWIFGAIALKGLTVVVGFIRHKKILFLHSIGNKVFVFALFTFPLFYLFVDPNIILTVILVFATTVFIEDIAIHILSPTPDVNVKSVFHVKK